jgi:photosystem II stability/assembly factor-like uncharacterized protein
MRFWGLTLGLVLLGALSAGCGSSSTSISVRGPLEHREYPGGRGAFIMGLAVAPQNPDTVYAAVPGECRIFKSIDGGRSWRNVGLVGPANPLHDWDSQCVDDVWAGRGNVVYASPSDSSYYESSDGARSWHKIRISKVAVAEPQDQYSVADPRDARVIYAVRGHRLSRSADDGQTWRKVAHVGPGVVFLAIARNGKVLYATTSKGAVIRVRLTG